jgi:hypothetical protein
MRCHVLMLLFALVNISVFSQEPPAKADRGAVAFAQKAAVRALDFREGDTTSLQRARPDFTADGWADFMRAHGGLPR